ncbi:MAG: LamG domain-containing protein, partial [Elioraea sp.]|nr:LamG domain-containing protein [Elioraea sp.]
NGRVVFGVAKGESGATVCGQREVTDGDWHHIAVTREAASGRIRLFVDGRLDGEALGPAGDVSYRLGRATGYANDLFLVFGAEKHDYDPATYPSFRGWLDEVRLSTVIRYSADFERPRAPFQPDAETAALWHFDEGAGELTADSAPGGASPGRLKVGGPNNGPQWVPS